MSCLRLEPARPAHEPGDQGASTCSGRAARGSPEVNEPRGNAQAGAGGPAASPCIWQTASIQGHASCREGRRADSGEGLTGRRLGAVPGGAPEEAGRAARQGRVGRGRLARVFRWGGGLPWRLGPPAGGGASC